MDFLLLSPLMTAVASSDNLNIYLIFFCDSKSNGFNEFLMKFLAFNLYLVCRNECSSALVISERVTESENCNMYWGSTQLCHYNAMVTQLKEAEANILFKKIYFIQTDNCVRIVLNTQNY